MAFWKNRLFPITIVFLSLALLSACSGVSGSSNAPPTNTGPSGGTTTATFQTAVKHIIFIAQENEGFDHYYSQINKYRASLHLSTDVHVTPANPEPNPAFTGTDVDGKTCPVAGSSIPPFHLRTVCLQNLSPFWSESHVAYNMSDPTSTTFKGDGFAHTAGNYASTSPDVPTAPGVGLRDVCGYRAMGFYDQTELNYYYFMTSQYALADNWFAPAPTRTQVNRIYLYAATSQGHVSQPLAQLNVPTIFDRLQAAGVSWRIYYTDCHGKIDARQPGVTCAPANQDQYFQNFSSSNDPKMQANVKPVSEFFTDVQSDSTLPAVVQIEGGYETGLDEHPKSSAQVGAAYVKSLIDAVQKSPDPAVWAGTIFILTYDEGGDFFDHVQPLNVPNPDGIQPQDAAGTVCTSGPGCDFTRTGYRLPVMIVSPFATPHAITHTGYDNTAILKLIESRFNLSPLTQRDASMPDLSVDSGLFDWSGPNLTTPKDIPAPNQLLNGTCDQFAFTP